MSSTGITQTLIVAESVYREQFLTDNGVEFIDYDQFRQTAALECFHPIIKDLLSFFRLALDESIIIEVEQLANLRDADDEVGFRANGYSEQSTVDQAFVLRNAAKHLANEFENRWIILFDKEVWQHYRMMSIFSFRFVLENQN